MKEIKDRLKEALKIRELTAAQLARKSGISESSISRYITGKMEPKQFAIHEMSKALKVNPAWLLGYDVPMESRLEKIYGDLDVFVIDHESEMEVMIDKFRMLNDSNKQNAEKYIEFLLKNQED